jgi:hypothetical protein
MDLLNELARTDIDPALLAQVQALFAQQQADLTRRDALLAEKDFKITALTHELAYYRRIRFGKASEALVGEQRLLFEETVDTDLAAIEEELEGQAQAKRPRKRAGRQPLPPELGASSTAMSPHRASAANAEPNWSRSARTSASNWTWSGRAFSCIATSGRSTPAVRARR